LKKKWLNWTIIHQLEAEPFQRVEVGDQVVPYFAGPAADTALEAVRRLYCSKIISVTGSRTVRSIISYDMLHNPTVLVVSCPRSQHAADQHAS
jgi:hypothetical protein